MTATARVRGLLRQGLRNAPPSVQDAARKGASKILGAVGAPPIEENHPAPVPVLWESPAFSVPPGLSFEELMKTYRSWSVNGDTVGSLDPYVDDSIWRFLHTWAMVRDDAGTCLEIGSNPYFTTFLLDEYTNLDLVLSNFYGTRGEILETVSFIPPGRSDRVEIERHAHIFNVEEDAFPFETGTLDVVLFCETIEHLLMDPMAALREIHRVLKFDGVLILTTPNVARLNNVLSLVEGDNLYDPYSGYGPYGRHNREYTLHELEMLLGFAGFDVERHMTADGHLWAPPTGPRTPLSLPCSSPGNKALVSTSSCAPEPCAHLETVCRASSTAAIPRARSFPSADAHRRPRATVLVRGPGRQRTSSHALRSRADAVLWQVMAQLCRSLRPPFETRRTLRAGRRGARGPDRSRR